MTPHRRLGRGPGTIAAVVALVVLSYGPVTPELCAALGPGPASADAVVLGGARFSLSVPLARRSTVTRPAATRPASPPRRALVTAVVALLVGLVALARWSRRWLPVLTPADGAGRAGTPGHHRRRGPPPAPV